MFKEISYKKRLIYLLVLGTIAFILAYWIAISKTLETVRNLSEIKGKLEQIENAPKGIAVTEKNLFYLNARIGENLGDIPDFQKNLLDRISNYCSENTLLLRDFPQAHSWQKDDYRFITVYASIEGPFIPLLELLNKLETSHSPGRIVSVSFFSQEDRRTKKTKLTLSVYVQTIKHINNG